jgi:D-glycero-beta-D-manno-heptose 1-phosphate adenylyltransferase
VGKRIESLSEMKGLLQEARKAGKTIVFGNGCFDLLHVGHIRYLKGAKALGDILVVAINDDASVALLGKRKTVLTPASERAEIICAIDCVDYVVTFSESTVEPLLRELEPDIHAKGTDYTAETVPEREVVRSYGGRVAIVGDPKDHSTTTMIEQIRKMEDVD